MYNLKVFLKAKKLNKTLIRVRQEIFSKQIKEHLREHLKYLMDKPEFDNWLKHLELHLESLENLFKNED